MLAWARAARWARAPCSGVRNKTYAAQAKDLVLQLEHRWEANVFCALRVRRSSCSAYTCVPSATVCRDACDTPQRYVILP